MPATRSTSVRGPCDIMQGKHGVLNGARAGKYVCRPWGCARACGGVYCVKIARFHVSAIGD